VDFSTVYASVITFKRINPVSYAQVITTDTYHNSWAITERGSHPGWSWTKVMLGIDEWYFNRATHCRTGTV